MQQTLTTVTGYKADKSTRSSADSWTVGWDETYQTSATYNPGTPTYYYGYYTESWTCTIGKNKTSCNAPAGGGTCGHDNPLGSGNWGWDTNNYGGRQDYVAGYCKPRTYVTTNVSAGTAPYYSYTYGWQHKTAQYSDAGSAQAGYNWCASMNGAGDPGRTANCTNTKTDAVWTAPSTVSVPSCPMADTSTERYTNCVPVTRTDAVTTNYNVVDYRGEDPTQVIVTRDQLGTPKPSWATFYGLTNAGGSSKIFTETDGDNRTPKSDGMYQSQFATSPAFSSNTVAVASGAYRRLQTKGVWASDTGLPQVLTMAWYFTPSVKSTFAQTRLGFGRTGGRMTYTKGEYSSPVRGRVEALGNSLTTDDGMTLAQHQNQVWSNTGTNLEDNLNLPLFYGANRAASVPQKWTQDPTAYSPHYFVVKFVRAVGE